MKNSSLLHMALLSWKHGDISMIELKRLIYKLEHSPCDTCGRYSNGVCSDAYHLAPDRRALEAEAAPYGGNL
jgi:hypothetical protein